MIWEEFPDKHKKMSEEQMQIHMEAFQSMVDQETGLLHQRFGKAMTTLYEFTP